MGLQVLPLLCTTALWYDMSLLQQLWERWLLTDSSCQTGLVHDTLHSYVGVLVLKEIVKKVVPVSPLSRPVLPAENYVAAAPALRACRAHPNSPACAMQGVEGAAAARVEGWGWTCRIALGCGCQ